jgi:hypothetical protein
MLMTQTTAKQNEQQKINKAAENKEKTVELFLKKGTAKPRTNKLKYLHKLPY